MLLLQVKNVAYSLKYTGEPILKALTFKGITLFHSYRDKTVAEHRWHLSCWRLTGTSGTDLCGQLPRTKDSDTKKFVTINYIPSPFSIKEAWILTQVRWFFGILIHHLLGLLAFWIKSLFLVPTTCLLLACRAVSSMSLDSVTEEEGEGGGGEKEGEEGGSVVSNFPSLAATDLRVSGSHVYSALVHEHVLNSRYHSMSITLYSSSPSQTSPPNCHQGHTILPRCLRHLSLNVSKKIKPSPQTCSFIF